MFVLVLANTSIEAVSRTSQTPETVMLFILIGVMGQSSFVGTLEIAITTSKPLMICPKTGCLELPPENQSRRGLSFTFKKNCDPPEFGAPVFAIDNDPVTLESFDMNSSLILPPLTLFSMLPVTKF